MSVNKSPESHLREAAVLALSGYPAPNPRVGCVIVKSGEVVGRGWHEAAGKDHAEAMALREAGSAAQGADAFLTLEPCDHTGRTPPCTEALIKAGIRRVWIGVADPNPIAKGGASKLVSAGIEVQIGQCVPLCERVNEAFLEAHRRKRVFVIAKAAVSADGFMAKPDGTSKWITGRMARAEGHRLRAEAGAVLIGYRTALLDDPELTVRAIHVENQPLRLLLDPRRSLPESLTCLSGANPAKRVVLPEFAQGDDIQADSIEELTRVLFELGQTSLLVEGGPNTLGRFFHTGLVDRFDLFRASHPLGDGQALVWPKEEFQRRRIRRLDADTHESFKKSQKTSKSREQDRKKRCQGD